MSVELCLLARAHEAFRAACVASGIMWGALKGVRAGCRQRSRHHNGSSRAMPREAFGVSGGKPPQRIAGRTGTLQVTPLRVHQTVTQCSCTQETDATNVPPMSVAPNRRRASQSNWRRDHPLHGHRSPGAHRSWRPGYRPIRFLAPVAEL